MAYPNEASSARLDWADLAICARRRCQRPRAPAGRPARIFYAEGINSVGVARIVEEAGVTLATFYRHFPSKQDLNLAYLQRVHDDFDSRAAAAERPPKIPATCSG